MLKYKKVNCGQDVNKYIGVGQSIVSTLSIFDLINGEYVDVNDYRSYDLNVWELYLFHSKNKIMKDINDLYGDNYVLKNFAHQYPKLLKYGNALSDEKVRDDVHAYSIAKVNSNKMEFRRYVIHLIKFEEKIARMISAEESENRNTIIDSKKQKLHDKLDVLMDHNIDAVNKFVNDSEMKSDNMNASSEKLCDHFIYCPFIIDGALTGIQVKNVMKYIEINYPKHQLLTSMDNLRSKVNNANVIVILNECLIMSKDLEALQNIRYVYPYIIFDYPRIEISHTLSYDE